jgi:hypothetical protein
MSKLTKKSTLSDPIQGSTLSPESVALAQSALAALEKMGAEELSKLASMHGEAPAPKEKPARPARARRADLRLWDAVFELDEVGAREALADGAPAHMSRSGKTLFDRWFDGVVHGQARIDQEDGPQKAAMQQAFEKNVQALGRLLDQFDSRMRGSSWPSGELDPDELKIEPASLEGRQQALESWRLCWSVYAPVFKKALLQVALGWRERAGPGRMSTEQALDCVVQSAADLRWREPLHLAGDLCEATEATLTPSQWKHVEDVLASQDDASQAPILTQMLARQDAPLSAKLGALCAQVAINADDAKLLVKVASLGGLSSTLGYGHRRAACPALLFALEVQTKRKTEDGKIFGRDCFEVMAKVPEMVEAARAHFKASALRNCDGEEAVELLTRFPFMAGLDGERKNIAHSWSEGRYLSIQSIYKLKRLLNGGFASLLSQRDGDGKTPIDLIKLSHGTSALKKAVADWSETYAKWEKKEMRSDAPSPRSTADAKKAASKRL